MVHVARQHAQLSPINREKKTNQQQNASQEFPGTKNMGKHPHPEIWKSKG